MHNLYQLLIALKLLIIVMGLCILRKKNGWDVLIAFDQVCNVVFGIIISDMSYAYETLSGRAYRSHTAGYWYGTKCMNFIDWIFSCDTEGDKRHCQLSHENDKLRKIEYEKHL